MIKVKVMTLKLTLKRCSLWLTRQVSLTVPSNES